LFKWCFLPTTGCPGSASPTPGSAFGSGSIPAAGTPAHRSCG
jgi:hypothetical protein